MLDSDFNQQTSFMGWFTKPVVLGESPRSKAGYVDF
jgi:hypothetical protein